MTTLSSRLQPRPVGCSSFFRCQGSKLYWVGVSRSSSLRQLGSWPFDFAFISYLACGWFHLSTPVEPLRPWVCTGCRWEAFESDLALNLPTFARCIQRFQPPFKPADLDECSEQTLCLWRSFHSFRSSHPPCALAPVQDHASVSEHVAKVIRGSLLGNSFHVSLVASWLAALAAAAWPSFRHLRFQRLQEKMLLAPLPWDCCGAFVFAGATCAWTLAISAAAWLLTKLLKRQCSLSSLNRIAVCFLLLQLGLASLLMNLRFFDS